MDYTVRRYQETEKSRDDRPEQEQRQIHQIHQLALEKADYKRLFTTEPMSWTICRHPLWGEDSVKLAQMSELLSRNHYWGSKTISENSSELKRTKTRQYNIGINFFGVTNQSSKFLGQIVGVGSMHGEDLVKELQHSVSHQP